MTFIECNKGKISLHNSNGFNQFNLTKTDRDILKMAMSSYSHVIGRVGNSFKVSVCYWIDLIKEQYSNSNLNTQSVINTLIKVSK